MGNFDKRVNPFQKKIREFYHENKREFPWRNTTNTYSIYVSEIMLQQTQANRVIAKYNEFIHTFPDFNSLSNATLKDIYAVWQRMGYNRRAKFLQNAAEIIVKKHNGIVPSNIDELIMLPGIGYNTACSIAAFAFNKPVVFIETNIRSVFIHEFFADVDVIEDKEILPLVEQTLDIKNPREWYWALMDYGNYLKKQFKNPSRKSKHYAKQSVFEGSDRQLRGKILKLMLLREKTTVENLFQKLNVEEKRFKKILNTLEREGIIKLRAAIVTFKN